jgi:hypothetical protein
MSIPTRGGNIGLAMSVHLFIVMIQLVNHLVLELDTFRAGHIGLSMSVYWAPEAVWMQRVEEKSSAPAGDGTPVIQSVVRHYNE